MKLRGPLTLRASLPHITQVVEQVYLLLTSYMGDREGMNNGMIHTSFGTFQPGSVGGVLDRYMASTSQKNSEKQESQPSPSQPLRTTHLSVHGDSLSLVLLRGDRDSTGLVISMESLYGLLDLNTIDKVQVRSRIKLLGLEPGGGVPFEMVASEPTDFMLTAEKDKEGAAIPVWKVGLQGLDNVALNIKEDLVAEVHRFFEDGSRLSERVSELYGPIAPSHTMLLKAFQAAMHDPMEPEPLPRSFLDKDLHEIEKLRVALSESAQSKMESFRRDLESCRSNLHKAVNEVTTYGSSFQSRARSLEKMAKNADLQRIMALALHDNDFSGYLRVGKGTQAAVKEGSKKFFTFPKMWCVLRGDLLLCYDRPGSFNVNMTFSLSRDSIDRVTPGLSKSSKHYRTLHVFLLSDQGVNYIFVSDSEEESKSWLSALAPYTALAADFDDMTPTGCIPTPWPLSPRSAVTSPSSTPIRSRTPKEKNTTLKGLGKKVPDILSLDKTSATTRHRPNFSFSPGGMRLTRQASKNRSAGDLKDLVGESKTSAASSFLTSLSILVKGVVQAETNSKAGASYVIEVHPKKTGASSWIPTMKGLTPSKHGGPKPLKVLSKTWDELLTFHTSFFEAWLGRIEHERRLVRHGTGEFDDGSIQKISKPIASGKSLEAHSYGSKLLIGSKKLLQTFYKNQSERNEQVRILNNYFSLVMTHAPSSAECSRLLQELLEMEDSSLEGNSSQVSPVNVNMEIATPFTRQNSLEGNSKAQWTVRSLDLEADELDETDRRARDRQFSDKPLRSLLANIGEAVNKMERKTNETKRAIYIHRVVIEEYMLLIKRKTSEKDKVLVMLQEQLKEEKSRSSNLETKYLKAKLAKDEATFTMMEVSSHYSKRLVDAELRYAQLQHTGGNRLAGVTSPSASVRRNSFSGLSAPAPSALQRPPTPGGDSAAHQASIDIGQPTSGRASRNNSKSPPHLLLQGSASAHKPLPKTSSSRGLLVNKMLILDSCSLSRNIYFD